MVGAVKKMKKYSAPKRAWVSYCTTCGRLLIANASRKRANTDCYGCPSGGVVDVVRYVLVLAPTKGLTLAKKPSKDAIRQFVELCFATLRNHQPEST